jgi:hypothetical protein
MRRANGNGVGTRVLQCDGHRFIGSTPDPVIVATTECTVTGEPDAILKSAWLFSPSATAASGAQLGRL